MNFEHALGRADAWRRRSAVLGIPVAVIKKFLDGGADALGAQVSFCWFSARTPCRIDHDSPGNPAKGHLLVDAHHTLSAGPPPGSGLERTEWLPASPSTGRPRP